jgi:amino acid adenylation domain-containing protein
VSLQDPGLPGLGRRRIDFGGAVGEPVSLSTGTAKHDLTVALFDAGPGTPWTGSLGLAADLFDPTTARRWADRFAALAGTVLEQPETALHRLPLLGPAERQQVVEMAVPREPGVARGETLDQRIHRVARRHPDRPAVTHGGHHLTYGALSRRSLALARALVSRGVEPGQVVALFVERSPDMVVAIVAALTAGAAYVPLDTSQPDERLVQILEDSGAHLLVHGRADGLDRRAAALADDHPVAALALTALEGDGSAGPARAVPLPDLAALGGRHLAYVLFTSGSTGRPKGVMIAHDSLGRLMATLETRHGRGGDDVWTLAHAFGFDASVLEIWSALWWGGRLVVVPAEVARSPRELWGLVESEGVTSMLQTPALARETVRVVTDGAGEGGRGPGPLRLFLVGGDTVDPALFDPWFEAYGDRRTEVVNVYGITETTIVDTERRLRFPEVAAPGAQSPIGRPYAHVGTVLLDRAGEPVPPGVPGEVQIAGPAVAWGYRGRPGLTAERFVPDPFAALAGTPGGRLYRSGDLARLLPSGDLDYLGRIDRQIQVRGFRIELGEIEAALTAVAAGVGVSQSVVVARPDPRGALLPVAYLVAPGGGDDGPAADDLVARIRDELTRRLPGYMLPAAFVVLPELPLNSSGKVDRGRLPEPGSSGRSVARSPRGAVEETLAVVWSDLTGVAEVSADDDFFHLGGHSLLAVRLVAKIEQAFGIELPLVEVFDHPRLAELAQRVERRTALGPTGALPTPPLEPLSADSETGPGRAGLTAPLTHSQERLWFLHRLDPGSTAYHIPLALDLDGPLAAPALGRALTAVVARHEALRTRFEPGPEGPVQRVAAPVAVPLPVVDLGGLEGGRGAVEALRWAGRFTRVPFRFGRRGPGLLARGLLLRRAPSRHLFLVVQHHIASDGWSQGVLVRDLRAVYEATLALARPELPALPVQVPDVAAWQRSWLDGEVLARRTEAWSAVLDGVPLLQLPTDRPRPALRSERGATVAFTVPRELARELRAVGLARGATLFVVLMATLQALLARRTGRDDFAVGTPVAGRERPEVMDLVGFFVNTLVLRSSVDGDPTFGQLVERVRQRTLDAWSLQDLPFEKLVEVLAPERDLSHTPLFQVALALQVPGLPGLEMEPGPSGRLGVALGEAWAEPVDPGATAAKNDLAFALVDGGADRALHGTVEYSTALFDQTTVERWARSLLTLAREASAHPERRLGELPLLSRAERQQAVVELVVPLDARPAEGGLDRLFFAAASRRPDAVAVRWQDRSLTYGELAREARALARGLVAQGVRPEEVVGLVFDRRLEMVVAILGVLAAGAAYLPLDPAQPDERLGQMVETARPRLLVVGPESEAASSTAAHLARAAGATAAAHDDLIAAGRQQALELPDLSALAGDHLAYVLFTSGSTGRPKGVMVPHRGVVQLVERMRRILGTTPDDVWVLFHSFGFDASVMEMWSALATGSSLVLVPSEVTRSPRELGDLMESEGVTVMIQTPSLCRELLSLALERQAAGRPWRWEGLRYIKVGGEAVDPAQFADWFRHQRGGTTRVFNLYGITETSIDSTHRLLCERDARSGVPASPIGRPLPHVGLTLLDRRGEPVPLGTPGELVQVGDSVTRGYFGEPARTAARFLPDPFCHLRGEPGGRLYRTGDLVRLLPTGDLDFLGRIDHQVQVRGFRIELGEIEAAILATPGVVQAVVVARPDRRGEVRPVAYLVAAGGAPGGDAGLVAAVKGELSRRLPDYMMPAAFVSLSELPTNSSGKVDRRALPDPETPGPAETGGEASQRQAREAPRSRVEEAIAAVWRDVLELERVGIHDNFFDLGGHSLLATRVHERLLAQLDPEMPLMDLFQHPTVSALAAAIVRRGSHRTPAAVETPPPRPLPDRAERRPVEVPTVSRAPSSAVTDARERAARRRRRRGLAPSRTGSSEG